MNFESEVTIGGVLWTPEDKEDLGKLKPIIGPLSDLALSDEVILRLGLQDTGFAFGKLGGLCRPFEGGRTVQTFSMQPMRFAEARPNAFRPERWFRAADFVVRLQHGRGTGCYGISRAQVTGLVFQG